MNESSSFKAQPTASEKVVLSANSLVMYVLRNRVICDISTWPSTSPCGSVLLQQLFELFHLKFNQFLGLLYLIFRRPSDLFLVSLFGDEKSNVVSILQLSLFLIRIAVS